MIPKNLSKNLLLLCLAVTLLPSSGHTQTWVDDTFQDFAKGTLDASGQNIYISKKGEIRIIRRFDLNNDGYIDLLFNSTHNDDVAVPASITTYSMNRERLSVPVEVDGSIAAEVADLNKDGYPDIVFCPNTQYGAQTPHRYVSIAYGGKEGWLPERINGLLPVNNAKGVVVADLNGDGWPDIVTLNSTAWLPGQPEGNIARIYWGGTHGFILTEFQDIGIVGGVKMVTGNFNADGIQDIAFLTENNTIQVLWGKNGANADGAALDFETTELKLPGKKVLSIAAADVDGNDKVDFLLGGDAALYVMKGKENGLWDEPITIAGIKASSIATGDIDEDGSVDLVVSYFAQGAGGAKSTEDNNITILWGDNGSFSSSRVTRLESPYTVAAAIGDVDGDGHNDIVCANYQGEKTYATESILYFGKGNRGFERGGSGIPSSGAYDVTVIPAGETRATAVLMNNSRMGNLHEELPLLLYYGGAEGFNEENLLKIPFNSGYESSAADLNEDGYVDLIAINAMHAGQADNPYRGVNIFWGSEDGYDIENRRTVLNENNTSTSNVADLNRDGYLDLIIGFFDHTDGSPTKVVIYYGSETGYELSDRVTLLSEGRSSSPMIADYNKDGWLDIVVNSYSKDLIRVFWGSPKGFSEENQQILTLPSVIDLETADLNNDGYLDLIASSYNDKINHHHDTGVLLFWGGPTGFKEWDAQWLPSSTVLGPVAADFDDDGYLDLFLPSYHGEITRVKLPMYLYWGGAEGYSTKRRSTFILDSGADALAADFNKDGRLDLAVASHCTDGAHSKAVSKVFYNDGERFKSASMRVEDLPSAGSHWMWNYDMGNIYTRKLEESYVSSVRNWKKKATTGRIDVEAVHSVHSNFTLAIRSAATENALLKREWHPVKNGEFALGESDRYLQYKVTFLSDNGDEYPILKKVTVSLK